MLNPKLNTLLTAAELGSFTRAASALHLTQPAVSHHIKELEQQLGAALFLRKKGQISLTPEGEVVVQYVRRMKALEQQMLEELKSADRRLTRRHHAHGGKQPYHLSAREIRPGKRRRIDNDHDRYHKKSL